MRIALLLPLFLLLMGCTGSPPSSLGVQNQRLAPCTSSPNCVSSFESDPDKAVEPLKATLDEVELVVRQMERTDVITATPEYLHVEYRSLIFRFVDDVEFLFDSQKGVTHVRSASRLGHSDLGVNRDRVEALRSHLE